jgi:hypothetical protein
MSQEPDQGRLEGHTAAEFHGKSAQAEQVDQVAALVAQLQPQASLPGLTDEPADDLDMLGRVAETVNAKRRARGRPSGSANKRNSEVFDYLEARGFKAPEVRLMEIVTADARDLAAAISGPHAKAEAMDFDKVLEVMRLQIKAAETLMPYKYAKRQELKVESNQNHLHVMMAVPLGGSTGEVPSAFSLTGEANSQVIENIECGTAQK